MPKRSIFKIEELRDIISNYKIVEIKHFEEFEKGEENINILVEANEGRYVLRIYNLKRIKNQILFELSIINYLYKNGFPVPRIIPNKNNKLFFNYRNYFVVLFSYIDGDTFRFSDLNKKQLSNIAYNLSLMHKLLINFSPKGYKKREDMFLFNIEYSIQKEIFPKVTENTEFSKVKEIINQLKKEIPSMEIILSKFNKDIKIGIVHNDFQNGNIKFKGNEISGIFDFDDSSPGAIVSDLAIAINNFCFEEDRLNKKKLRLFLKNYEKNITLSENEKKAIIPLMIHTNSFSIHNALRLWFSDRKNKSYYTSIINWSYKKLKMLNRKKKIIFNYTKLH